MALLGTILHLLRWLTISIFSGRYSPFRPLIAPVWRSMELPVALLLNAPVDQGPLSERRDALTLAWYETKLKELATIGLIGSISSAAITGCFSLSIFESAHWATQGLFYGGLFTSIITLVTVLQQTTTLNRLGSDAQGLDRLRKVLSSENTQDGGLYVPSMLQIYVWQVPILLLNITLIAFLLGLTLLVLPIMDASFSTSRAADVGKVFGPIALFALLNYVIPAVLLSLAVDVSEKQPLLVLPGPTGVQQNAAQKTPNGP